MSKRQRRPAAEAVVKTESFLLEKHLSHSGSDKKAGKKVIVKIIGLVASETTAAAIQHNGNDGQQSAE